ncbi:ubiquitin-related domain-containing protein [Gongronella butleri]|nr:ubiquitin-related domain-containing protein [Gongronella butleri]
MVTISNEQQYIDQFLGELSNRSVRYGKDYLSRSLPSPLLVKKQPKVKKLVQEDAAAPAKREISSDAGLSVVIKILKPASQFKITRLSADATILDLKQRIYQQQMIPVKQQRLLMKGKVLSDDKSLADYKMTNDTTLHLMVKAAPAAAAPTPDDDTTSSSIAPADTPAELSQKGRETLATDALWASVHQSLQQHLSPSDADLVIAAWKRANV